MKLTIALVCEALDPSHWIEIQERSKTIVKGKVWQVPSWLYSVEVVKMEAVDTEYMLCEVKGLRVQNEND